MEFTGHGKIGFPVFFHVVVIEREDIAAGGCAGKIRSKRANGGYMNIADIHFADHTGCLLRKIRSEWCCDGDIVQKAREGFNSDFLPFHIEKLLILKMFFANLLIRCGKNCESEWNLLAYTQD